MGVGSVQPGDLIQVERRSDGASSILRVVEIRGDVLVCCWPEEFGDPGRVCVGVKASHAMVVDSTLRAKANTGVRVGEE